MRAYKSRSERGMALAVAIFALVVVASLVAMAFYSGRLEQRAGRNTMYAAQASDAAEAGAAVILGNWDQYALNNLAVGATRVLSLIPGAQGWATVGGQLIRGVGALVKGLASGVVTENGVPGLAAMEPDGEFVTAINKHQAGQPAAAAQYFAVTSDFEPRKALSTGGTPELPPKLLMRIAESSLRTMVSSFVSVPSVSRRKASRARRDSRSESLP